MKHLSIAVGTVFVVCGMAAAAISNWDLPNDQPYEPSDSLEFSYSADNDTTLARIFIETGEASSGLDSAEDGLMFTIMLIDNNIEERWGDEKGLMADRDPNSGDFLFSPGRIGLPAGLYHIRLTDGDGSEVDTFRVVPLSDPSRTVSGTVVPPSGEDASFIMVTLEGKDMEYSLSAFTDASGDYSIGVDQETVDQTGGMVRVRIEAEFEGFIPDPMAHEMDISDGDKSGVDFSFAEATCSVSGTVLADNEGVPDVRVVLMTSEYDPVTSGGTDEDGNFMLYCVAGTYLIRAEIDRAEGFLFPKEMKVELQEGDDKTVTIELPKADASIYGRVTVEGESPSSMSFAISAWNEEIGGTWTATDEDGYFTIPVVAAGGKYNVSLDDRDDYPIPEAYIIENGQQWMEIEVGDSALFNLIDKPSGGIAGTITNETSFEAARYFVRVYSPDQSGGGFQFETMSDGSYTFDGIPEGSYYVEAGMSVAGGDEWNWKVRLQYGSADGQMEQITIGSAIIEDIDWMFTDADTGQGGPVEQKGSGTLLLTVNNETGVAVEKGTVMLFENMPGPDHQEMPLRVYEFQNIDEELVLTEAPDRQVYVGVELGGTDGDMYRRFVAFVTGSDGQPSVLDFTETDTVTASVTVQEADSMSDDGGPVEPMGNGKVSGTVTYTGELPTDKMYVLLYDEDNEDFIRGVSPMEDGSYVIDNIAPGTYRIAAVIDVDDDKQPEALAIGDDSLSFTDDESYEDIDITFADKPTGSGGITGTVSSTFTLPEKSSVIVAAIPIDTNKTDEEQLNQAALMMAYHVKMEEPGDYTIEDLPDGVYYMVAIAEVPDDSSEGSHEVGFGIHGTMLADLSAELPFDPTPVIVADGEVTADIDIALIPNGDDIPVRHERGAVPAIFSMNAPVVNRSTGMVQLQLALPEKAMVGFRVFDLTGRMIARLAAKEYAAGCHTVSWNLFGATGRSPANGTYVLLLEGNRYTSRQLLKIIR